MSRRARAFYKTHSGVLCAYLFAKCKNEYKQLRLKYITATVRMSVYGLNKIWQYNYTILYKRLQFRKEIKIFVQYKQRTLHEQFFNCLRSVRLFLYTINEQYKKMHKK